MRECETAPTPKNDPRLLRQVYVKVIKSFCVDAKPVEIGAEVAIAYHVARDMVALKKAEIVDASEA